MGGFRPSNRPSQYPNPTCREPSLQGGAACEEAGMDAALAPSAASGAWLEVMPLECAWSGVTGGAATWKMGWVTRTSTVAGTCTGFRVQV